MAEENQESQTQDVSDNLLEQELFGTAGNDPLGSFDATDDVSTDEGQTTPESDNLEANDDGTNEIQEMSDEELQEWVLNVDGQEVTKKFTPEQIKAALQKDTAFNQRMSKLDLERKEFERQKQEMATNISQMSKGDQADTLEQIRQTDSDLYADIFNLIHTRTKQKANPKVSELDKEIDDFIKLSQDDGVKDIPILGKSAALLKKMAGRISELENNGMNMLNSLNEKVNGFDQYKLSLEEQARTETITKQADRLRGWAKENNITIDPNTPHISAIQSIMASHKLDVIDAAKFVYGVKETASSEKAPEKKKETQIREKKRVREKAGRGRTPGLSEQEEKISNEFFGNAKSEIFG
jgi:hypothetical protein